MEYVHELAAGKCKCAVAVIKILPRDNKAAATGIEKAENCEGCGIM